RGQELDILWMKQIAPKFGQTFEVRRVAPVLGLSPSDLDRRFPIEVASTGLPFIIVPVKTLEAVRKSRVRLDQLLGLIQDSEAKAFLLFSPETDAAENDLHVRVFAHYLGVPEDPATGSANGCLAGYLVRHRFFGSSQVDLRAEQGHEIGRSSLLLLRAEEKAGEIDVFVGGRVILVARGELL
ncbi:MAG: PhzF family phenazine biosynthesis protein, partial [Acidobacteriota bacterium]